VYSDNTNTMGAKLRHLFAGTQHILLDSTHLLRRIVRALLIAHPLDSEQHACI
jgi:hypothetical protein